MRRAGSPFISLMDARERASVGWNWIINAFSLSLSFSPFSVQCAYFFSVCCSRYYFVCLFSVCNCTTQRLNNFVVLFIRVCVCVCLCLDYVDNRIIRLAEGHRTSATNVRLEHDPA